MSLLAVPLVSHASQCPVILALAADPLVEYSLEPIADWLEVNGAAGQSDIFRMVIERHKESKRWERDHRESRHGLHQDYQNLLSIAVNHPDLRIGIYRDTGWEFSRPENFTEVAGVQLQTYPVTHLQWNEVGSTLPSFSFPFSHWVLNNRRVNIFAPVMQSSWQQANEYIEILNKREQDRPHGIRYQYRLPSMLEMENAFGSEPTPGSVPANSMDFNFFIPPPISPLENGLVVFEHFSEWTSTVGPGSSTQYFARCNATGESELYGARESAGRTGFRLVREPIQHPK